MHFKPVLSNVDPADAVANIDDALALLLVEEGAPDDPDDGAVAVREAVAPHLISSWDTCSKAAKDGAVDGAGAVRGAVSTHLISS